MDATGMSSSGRKRSSLFKALISIVVLTAIGFSAGFYYYPIKQAQEKSEVISDDQDAVILGLAHEFLASLAIIAHGKGFFAEHGANVQVKHYASGKLALNGLMAGDVDLATTADIPIVFKSMDRQDFKIISTIGSSDNEPRIIARKDSGIQTPGDLRGKRIATQKASAVHFFLHVFLLKNGMATDDVKLSYMKGKDLPAALAAGEIDAFSMREPFIGQASEQIGPDNVVIFSEPGLYRKTFNLVVSRGLIRHKPDAIRKIVSALMQAEAFAAANPDEAIKIVASTLGAKPEKIANVWADASLKVSLDQSLLVGLEDEAQWVISNKFTDVAEAPAYLDLIYLDALNAIDPVMVSLIH